MTKFEMNHTTEVASSTEIAFPEQFCRQVGAAALEYEVAQTQPIQIQYLEARDGAGDLIVLSDTQQKVFLAHYQKSQRV